MHILLRKNSEYYVTKIIYGNGTTIEKKKSIFSSWDKILCTEPI